MFATTNLIFNLKINHVFLKKFNYIFKLKTPKTFLSFPGLIEHYPELNVQPSQTLDRLVRERKFGQKSGQGFYKYRAKM